jgi:ABC-2 type transport system permease protein
LKTKLGVPRHRILRASTPLIFHFSLFTFRSLRWAAWLGWQLESIWASPWLFVRYSLVKPLAGSRLLVCMYWAARTATTGQGAPGFLPFLYVSSACFMVLGGVTFGMSNAIVSVRESYSMLKFIRISPVRLRSFLIGRGLARAGQAGVGTLLTLTVGLLLFPEIRDAFVGHEIAWGWLLLYLFSGAVLLVALGLLLAAAVLNMSRYGMFLSKGVAGDLYLLSGAIFPIDVLPPWLRPVSLVLPPTYWLEGIRRALLGPAVQQSLLSDWDHPYLALALAASTLVLTITAHCFFRWGERRARRLGHYDETSGF